ncbi:hypothetical protein, partial [Asaia bogorensis]|uniref:hypothetical protein n=1 Tax=Asaia bogorensis TaxID=91915 RepID=UPI0013CF2796
MAYVLVGVWSAVNDDGMTVYQSNGTVVREDVSLGAGAVVYITSGATASELTGLNNTIYVLSGGVLKDSKIENGLVDVAAGASTHGNTLNSTITNYYSGATSRDDTWFNSGFDYNWATFASGAMVTGAQALS